MSEVYTPSPADFMKGHPNKSRSVWPVKTLQVAGESKFFFNSISMKLLKIVLAALVWAVVAVPQALAQSEFSLVTQEPSNEDNEPVPVFPVPTDRQLKWNETEFYAFFHYGMNTYTGREWGYGNESESTFNPTALPDPYQWMSAAKSAGMKGGIAVVKHHDGFCLWPTETTDHCVTNSGTTYGVQTNIPRDFADAARQLDMKYGFYVSPWDMSNIYWGETDNDGNYTDNYAKKVFLPQCAELAEYGSDQFEMWFDGATGSDYPGYYGGAFGASSTGYRTIDDATIYYDVPNLRDSIHKVCPDCVMWGVGGEARWIGNESGYAGETCWSMGSGESGSESAWQWKPGESDAKATSGGWFWKSSETLLTCERLFQMYLETVGRNATLILNLPPDQSGSLPEATVSRMAELGEMLTARLGTDLAPSATITVSEERTSGANRTYEATNLTDDDKDTYWATNDGTTAATITLTWDEAVNVHYVSLMEYIKKGQRIKGFSIETSEDGSTFTTRATGIDQTTVGYKRIIPLNGSTSASYGSGYTCKALRINITASRACPLLHTLSVY